MNLNLLNPRLTVIKKWMDQLLGSRQDKHEVILERVANSLMTMKDVEEFGKLSVEIFEAGYMKCFNDYKTKLNKMGINFGITSPTENKIT